MSIASQRIIVTVVGHDRTGIIAEVSRVLADAGVNILDISQTLLGEFFVMILLGDMARASVARILEAMGLAQVGTHGTTAALALL